MNAFDKLSSGIPLHEASLFFLKLKKADAQDVASSNYDGPDETGALEGQFAVPVEQVIAQMAKMVQNELKTHYAYMVYAESLRGFMHNGVAGEFEEHAHHETEHAEFLLRRMSVLGGPVQVPDIPAPPACADPVQIVKIMIRIEQEGINNWRILREMVGDENPTRFKVEEYLTREQEHLDELWQLLPQEERSAVISEGPGVQPPPEQAQQGVPPAPQGPQGPPVETAGVKTAGARVEKYHPDTFHQHGPAMKVALSRGNQRGTVIVPDVDLEGNYKTASADLSSRFLGALSTVKNANAAMNGPAPQLPPQAMGKNMDASPPTQLAGASAGQIPTAPKMAALSPEMAHKLQTAALVGGGGLAAGAGMMGGLLLGVGAKGRERMNREIHDPRLYSNLRGAFESDKDRVDAHKLLDRRKDHSVLSAMREGFTRGGGKEAKEKTSAMKFKRALAEMGSGQEESQPQQRQPTLSPEAEAYLAREAEADAAVQQNEDGFYRQKFEMAMQQLQAAQQESQGASQQMQSLQDQVNQGQMVQQQAMDQANQVQQAAMQNAQAAQAAAAQAMQQSLASSNELLQQQQLAVQMRDSVQAMKSSLMNMVQTQLPPATTYEAGVSGAAQQQQAEAQQAAAMGQENSQQPGQPAAQNQAGTPGSQPDAGTPPGSSSPGAGGPETSPTPSASGSSNPTQANASPSGQTGMAQEPPPGAKTSSAKLVGALVGAAGLGGGNALMSQMSNQPLRNKVQRLEGVESQGKGNFLDAMNLAQSKLRLALSEISERHPGASTAASAGIGAYLGAQAGPHAQKLIEAVRA